MRNYRRRLKKKRPNPKTVAKQEHRAERERALGAKQVALPDVKVGVILEDFEWDFVVRSRVTGMDRHAANHYPVSEDAHTAEEIVKRTAAGFQLLPRRWVVERTLAWLNRNRRLAKDFEASIASAKARDVYCLRCLLPQKAAKTNLPRDAPSGSPHPCLSARARRVRSSNRAEGRGEC